MKTVRRASEPADFIRGHSSDADQDAFVSERLDRIIMGDAQAENLHPATSPQPFPIHRLPPELLHSICAYLKPTEVANARLHCGSRTVAAIGLEYLVPEARIFTNAASLRQLEAITNHDVVRKRVHSLLFEADTLVDVSFQIWTEWVTRPAAVIYMQTLDRTPRLCDESRRRVYTHKLVKKKHPHAKIEISHGLYTDDQLKAGYECYKNYAREQASIEMSEHWATGIRETLKCLPNLEVLTISTAGYGRSVSTKMENALAPGLYPISLDQDHLDVKGTSAGVVPSRNLLIGAHDAGLKIKHLEGAFIHWRLLDTTEDDFEKMKYAVKHLRALGLWFYVDGDQSENSSIEPRGFFEKGRLQEFVGSPVALEKLFVACSWHGALNGLTLKSIAGKFHWPCLKVVRFREIGATEKDLVAFCQRHSATLVHLGLSEIVLEEGSWWKAFEGMRRCLKAVPVDLDGYLVDNIGGSLCFQDNEGDFDEPTKLGIEDYLINQGDEPWLPLEEYLENWPVNMLPYDADSDSGLDKPFGV